MSKPTVVVKNDYDGYFERLVEQWLDRAEKENRTFKFSKIVVSAAPFRSCAVEVFRIDEETARLDFYSALRTGFGSLSDADVVGILDLISTKEGKQ